jgi:hypothetical protein
MFKEIKSEDELISYLDNISWDNWNNIAGDKSFAKVNPEEYENFDLEKYPNGLIPLFEYLDSWANINDIWWYLDEGDVIFLMWEEDVDE